ncbi:MAG: 50S ribosomal protein L15 [Thaumarchaeota archaeon]|nr:50S ribosomal protein L15 [Nitrososphaerota archaeon]
MRGSRTMGFGQIGQHRHSGKQGGHGNAGLHKHKWSWLNTAEGKRMAPDHFGRDDFHPPSWRRTAKWANVGDLAAMIATPGATGPISIDLDAKGVEKLLGGGDVTFAFNVKVSSFTKKAKQKLEEAGGKILTE